MLLLGTGIAFVAFNLRAGVASVAPLTAELRASGMSANGISLLLAIPAICFGVFGVLGSILIRRFSIEDVMAGALGLLSFALAARVWFDVLVFFAGTVLAMIAIAVLNVVLPALIKQDFDSRAGLLTGVYVTVYGIGAGAASGLTVPFVEATGSWQAGLAMWAVPAGAACVIWAKLPRQVRAHGPRRTAPAASSSVPLLRDRVAWLVTLFVAVSSIPAYVSLVWLPSMFESFGLTAAQGGLLLALLSVIGAPASLIVPAWAARAKDQRPFVLTLASLILAGILGLLLHPLAAPIVWLVLLGVGMSGSFSLALSLIVLRSRLVLDTGRLSGMAQCAAFLVAALASYVAGQTYHFTGSWRPALIMLGGCVVAQAGVGWGAAKPRFLGEATVSRQPIPTAVEGR